MSESASISAAGFEAVDGDAAVAATGRWWTETSAEYLAEHGEFLGPADFCWCPEGLRESEAGLLGPVEELRGTQVLEVGAGAAQCSRWLAQRGATVLATDISAGMLEQAAKLDAATGVPVRTVCADARDLPLDDASFDHAFTAFGAIPFVPDAAAVHTEVARVLRPGGRWVFAVTHPIRWAFPDDPSAHGLTAIRSYFDRTPYVERDEEGEPIYAEFHRTLGDHVREVTGAGFVIQDLVEPEWPQDNEQVWGGWGPERGRVLPGTAIFVCRKA